MKLIKVFLIIMLTACEVKYPWELQSVENHTIVVDGILTNEFKAQCIRLSLVNSEINMPYQPFSNAIVSVAYDNYIYMFNESSVEPGTYYSNPFQAVVGKTYTLTIRTDSVTYTANANMVAITPLNQINFIQDKGSYRYVHIKQGDPSMIEVYYNWASNSTYCASYGSCQAQETFYILNNVDVNKELGPGKDTIFFPKGTQIIRRKYSLSEEHQIFLRSLLIETEWRGGIFDVQQGNVFTNITNGAKGFFGACMVLTDTTIVN